MSIFDPTHDFFRAIHNARVATRRKDFAAADKWMTLAERHVRMVERMAIAQKRIGEVTPYINPPAPPPR